MYDCQAECHGEQLVFQASEKSPSEAQDKRESVSSWA